MAHIKKFNEGFGDLFKSKKQKLREKHFKTHDLSKKEETPKEEIIKSTPDGKYFARQSMGEDTWLVFKQSGGDFGGFESRPITQIRKTKDGVLILIIPGMSDKKRKIKVPSVQRGLDYFESEKKKESDERSAREDTWDEEID
tara:strand:+ start:19537 stop:19962 length:426 start_codon:yes stop_codon:yes gene_type:complete